MNTILLYVDTGLLAVPMVIRGLKKTLSAWAMAKMLKSVRGSIQKHADKMMEDGISGIGSSGDGTSGISGSAGSGIGGSSSS